MKTIFTMMLIGITSLLAQENNLARVEFLIGSWSGSGSGFGNAKSTIEAEYKSVMNGQYIYVEHNSQFEPTGENPEGEKHTDMGFFSFDKVKNAVVYRQFNIEGFVNKYVLVDSLSNETKLVFETDEIENFVPGGKARWTVIKLGKNEIETVFDLSFPGKEFACFGRNKLTK